MYIEKNQSESKNKRCLRKKCPLICGRKKTFSKQSAKVRKILILHQLFTIYFLIMQYFTEDFLQFYRELAANNQKEWFQLHRKRYEKSVKEPFFNFVKELLEVASKENPAITLTPSQAIFRINRDIRFSTDKTIYKVYSSAVVSAGTSRGAEMPGFYFQIGPGELEIYTGAYSISKPSLDNLRQTIADNPSELTRLLDEPVFKSLFGEMQGEKNVRLPKALQAAAEQQPYIANKQFYFKAELAPEACLQDDFLETLLNYYRASVSICNYLQKGMFL